MKLIIDTTAIVASMGMVTGAASGAANSVIRSLSKGEDISLKTVGTDCLVTGTISGLTMGLLEIATRNHRLKAEAKAEGS